MAIRGEVQTTELGNVFQMVAAGGRRTGLWVRHGREVGRAVLIEFEGETLRLATPPRSRPLPALLLARGLLSAKAFRQLDARSRRATSARGLRIPRDVDVQATLEEETILEVFSWPHMTFRVVEGGAERSQGSGSFPLDRILMEAARRGDEHARVPGCVRHSVYEPVDAPPIEAVADNWREFAEALLSALDGRHDLERLVREQGWPRIHTEIALAQLHEVGCVRALGVEELETAARKLPPPVAERLLAAALASSPDDPVLHRARADALVRVPALHEARKELRWLHAHHREADDEDAALDVLKEIHALLPTDFGSLVDLVQLLATRRTAERGALDEDLLEAATRLAEHHELVGERARALDIARAIHAAHPGDEAALARLARLLVETGERDEAIAIYRDLAERRRTAGRDREAIAVYRTLASLDPRRAKDHQRRAASLERRRERRRLGRRRIRIGAIVLGVALLLGLAWAGWTQLAHESLQPLVARPEPDTVIGLEQHADELLHAAAGWAWTPAAGRARERAEFLGRRAREITERGEAVRAAARMARERDLEIALREADRAVQARRPGRVSGILEGAIRAAREAGCEGALLDRAVALRRDAATYLEEAAEELEAIAALRRAGRREEAHGRALALHGSHPAAPRVRELELPIRIEVAPPGATIHEGDRALGTGGLELSLGPTARRSFEVSAPGHLSREVVVVPEATGPLLRVVLDRRPDRVLALGEARATALGRGADGRLLLLDGRERLGRLEGDRLVWSSSPEGLRDGDVSRFLVGDALVSVAGKGTLRRRDAEGKIVVRRLDLEPEEDVLDVMPGESFLLLSTSRGRLAALDPTTLEGRLTRRLADGPPRALLPDFGAAGGVLDARGRLLRLSAEGPRAVVGVPLLAQAVGGGRGGFGIDFEGRLLHFTTGGAPRVLETLESDVVGELLRSRESAVVLLLEGGTLLSHDGSRRKLLPLAAPVDGLAAVIGDSVLLRRKGGGFLVADLEREAILHGLPGPPEAPFPPIRTREGLVWALGPDRLGLLAEE